ncbi:MAG: glycosyltransferase family 2 protein [Planctomycetota bacterium]
MRFSLVVPVYNEEENVVPLLDEVAEVLGGLGPHEVLMVDDASSDRSVERMAQWKERHRAAWLRVVLLENNRGQSAAVMAGAERAGASIVLVMDGDMQNDPRDFARMLELVESGEYEGVTGLRAQRKDTFVRRMSSRVGNRVRNWITGDRVLDAASGIKAFRRSVFLRLPRFHGMHRFMATLARWTGARVTEIPVHHRPRQAGQAKYGIGNRALRGLADCFAVRWYRRRWIDYAVKEER